MKFKKISFLLVSTLILLFHTPPILSAPKVQFSIVYTNDVMGEVELCG